MSMNMARLDYALLNLLRDNGDIALDGAVRQVQIDSGEHLTFETVITEGDSPLESIRPPALALASELDSSMVQYLIVPHARGDFLLAAWPTEHEGVYHLVSSVPHTDPRWQKVERWVGRARPTVVPCCLNHADFVDIGRALADAGDAEVVRLTARNLVEELSLHRGWKSRSGNLRPSPLQVIAEAEQNGESVRTMTIKVENLLTIHIRRLAGATFYSGHFELFKELVLDRLASAVGSRRQLMADRQRRVGEPIGAPISIKLPDALLGDAVETAEVINELEMLNRTSVAVMHRNPYLHVVVTDYADGSNFDVFVTDPSAIEIYPGFRASSGALTRLSQQLGERFLAIEIAQAIEDEAPTLDELVVNG
ncbi:MAG: hypothetical protein HOV94_30925 [Saccharothrix sp.]|nr:hypothetical protein [Saccharothrix sp.]